MSHAQDRKRIGAIIAKRVGGGRLLTKAQNEKQDREREQLERELRDLLGR